MPQLTQTKEVLEELRTYTPGGVNSPVRACLSTGIDPLIIQSAKKDIIESIRINAFQFIF